MAPLGQGGDKQHATYYDRRGDVEIDWDIPKVPKHLGPLARCRLAARSFLRGGGDMLAHRDR
jgi:hypothetical protein